MALVEWAKDMEPELRESINAIRDEMADDLRKIRRAREPMEALHPGWYEEVRGKVLSAKHRTPTTETGEEARTDEQG